MFEPVTVIAILTIRLVVFIAACEREKKQS